MIYRAQVSSNMTNDLYMSKPKLKNSQWGYDDSYSPSKRYLASVEEGKRKKHLGAVYLSITKTEHEMKERVIPGVVPLPKGLCLR